MLKFFQPNRIAIRGLPISEYVHWILANIIVIFRILDNECGRRYCLLNVKNVILLWSGVPSYDGVPSFDKLYTVF